MTGILVGILVCFNPLEPETNLSTSKYHKLLPPFISRTVSVAEPIMITAFKSFDLDEMGWEEISPIASGRVPVVAAERHRKSQNSKATVEKIPTVSGKKTEHMLRPTIFRIAHRHRVDPAMVQAIIMAESSFNPNAVSKRGAIGLMQLMPNTAKSLGIKDPLNPELNITGGVLYFKKLLKEFHGDVTLALAAYNAGTRKVKEYQGVPPFKSTQVYIEKVLEYYQRYKSVPTQEDGRA
ncbi:MAG: lytic transglycosylase domain-containing protein [Desulfobacterales bacterium]